jgi:outer membrane scaffolding protein for murein synthesis (MipA/OmpV family)
MFKIAFSAAALLVSAPALAQQAAGLPDPNDRSDTFSIGAGAAYIPDYEGSNDYELTPFVGIRGRVSGIDFYSRGTHLYADFVPRGDGAWEFDAGPIVGARMNRTSDVKDDVVDRLPELDTAIELGGFVGASYHGLTNPYDELSFRVDVLKDVGGAHEGTLISPNLDFGTPLSRTFYIAASLNLEWASGDYADYYYSIDTDGALASGLPAFEADGGFKHWRIGLFANQSLSGLLTHGWSIFGAGAYTHLSGDFKDSPIVDDRGSASQWVGVLGVAYTF